MRRLPLIACFIASACCAPCIAADLDITLTDIRAQTGIIKLAVVDGPVGWDGKAKPVQATGAPPAGETQHFTLKDLAPGRYAVMVTHDENGNGKLDSNALGMPIEGYGFSNNPRVMRKPTWDETVFEIGAEDVAITVELR